MKSSNPTRRLAWLLLALMMVLAMREWVWMPLLIIGKSMQPTLPSGRIVLINKAAYHFGSPRRGDLVAVWTGRDLIIKRIIGLPGEEVFACEGVFYINGHPLPEPYVQFREGWNIGSGKVASDHFVIAGDNRSNTLLAVVARDRIIGRLMF